MGSVVKQWSDDMSTLFASHKRQTNGGWVVYIEIGTVLEFCWIGGFVSSSVPSLSMAYKSLIYFFFHVCRLVVDAKERLGGVPENTLRSKKGNEQKKMTLFSLHFSRIFIPVVDEVYEMR